MDLDRFAKDMVLAAGILGPNRIIHHLGAWARGTPIQATHIVVFRGLKMEQESLPLSEGVRLVRMSNNVRGLIRNFGPPATMVSPGMDMATALGSFGPDLNLLNATALCMDALHRPVHHTFPKAERRAESFRPT